MELLNLAGFKYSIVLIDKIFAFNLNYVDKIVVTIETSLKSSKVFSMCNQTFG